MSPEGGGGVWSQAGASGEWDDQNPKDTEALCYLSQ